jgi:opacity protein-like surface antigen
MKRTLIICLTVVLAAIAGIALPVQVAEAGCSRCGEWDFNLPINYADATTINGEGGSSVDLNSDWGIGFGLGYNFNDNFQLNGVFSLAYRGYEANYIREGGESASYNGNMDTATFALNGVYYFLDGNITPFVTAGIGFTNIDTNIPSGTGETYCYWDPWWGYVCNSYVPTKSENDATYNLGLGARWDINKVFGLQASYNKTWIDVSSAAGGMPDLDVFKFELVFRMSNVQY